MEKIDYRGHLISVEQDQFVDSPREWDNLGTIVCFHRKYNLGDSHDYTNPDEFRAGISEDFNLVYPLYLYDHSGITISMNPFSCPWDSGQVGWVYVSYEKILKEYGWKRLTRQRVNKIREVLNSEVETYDHYLRGDVYYFSIADREGDLLDSCGGLYGFDYSVEEAKKIVDFQLDKAVGSQTLLFQ